MYMLHDARGREVRHLNAQEEAAIRCEAAFRKACEGGADEWKAFQRADEILWGVVGHAGYAGATAFADQFFDRVREVPRVTLSEMITARSARSAGRPRT